MDFLSGMAQGAGGYAYLNLLLGILFVVGLFKVANTKIGGKIFNFIGSNPVTRAFLRVLDLFMPHC